jgi:hypothetical protein
VARSKAADPGEVPTSLYPLYSVQSDGVTVLDKLKTLFAEK